MKSYRVEIAPAVRKQIQRISQSDQSKILDVIETLGVNPRPHGYKKLVGFPDFFRYRVGNFRIIYQVFDEVLVVSVLKVANRRDAY